MSKLSFMFVGDVHLGRCSARLPHDLEAFDIDPQSLSPAAALGQAMKLAVDKEVSAVLFAGDLVDEMNDVYGAFGHMQAGIRCLTDAGIEAYAVAGNHDYASLPRLAKQIRGFHLLGAGGVWETKVFADAVQLVGWSFPSKKVEMSPLKLGFDRLALSTALPALGLLHCDLTGSSRAYAPVSSSELSFCSPPRGWFLGHIHQPSLLSAASPVGYLGSLMGLDPSEKGAHGPWIVGVGGEGISISQEPMAPVRWEEIEIHDSACLDADDAMEICDAACKKAHEIVTKAPALPRIVGCRIRVRGRTENALKLRRSLEQSELTQYRAFIGGVLYFVDKVYMDLELPVDLALKALGNDPVGILARHLLALERGDSSSGELVAAARAGLHHELENMAYFQRLPELTLSDADIRSILLQAGGKALEKMVAVQEVTS